MSSHVNADASALMTAWQNLTKAVSSIEATKTSISQKYRQLGETWHDSKYRELGEVVEECGRALNTTLKALLQGQKALLLLIKYIQEYEQANLGGASGASGSAAGTPSAPPAALTISPVSESVQNAVNGTYGPELSFAQDRLAPTRYFSRGSHYEAYQSYWENLSDYSYERAETPQPAFIRARDIEGVYLSDTEVANPEGFWTRNGRYNYSRQAILERASHIQDVAANLNNGRSIEEISQNPALSGAYNSYFSDPIQVVRVGDFYVFQADGRHRTLAAQTLDAHIPVLVTGTYVRR
jgi:hypothetical protein